MIRIIVDSSADYHKEELEAKNLELIPLTISLNENSYLDGVDITRDELYHWLIESKDFPKTSQPSPECFAALFQEAKEKGDEVICILLSSALSGTCQSAFLAKSMSDYDNIHIIDSLTVTHMIRILADKADTMRRAGASASDIVSALEALKSRVKVIAAVDTLEYLCRGGRLSRTAAAIGTLANLKPMITITTEGEVSVLGKCVGRNKSLSYLVNALQDVSMDSDYPMYTVYSYGTENCEALEEKLTAAGYSIKERLQIGATIGCHVGPGAFGVIYVEK